MTSRTPPEPLTMPHTGAMDDAVREYIDAIAPEHRPLFDRLHRLILEVCAEHRPRRAPERRRGGAPVPALRARLRLGQPFWG